MVHLLLDFYDCSFEVLNDRKGVEELLRQVVQQAGLTLLALYSHQFTPYGLSAIALISESHISIHTWPEEGYLCLDVFTCGDPAKTELVAKVCEEYFKPKRITVHRVPRAIQKSSVRSFFNDTRPLLSRESPV